ncbi:heme oxygenase-like protein [Panus rudis PR-1116 ss-1]|nr:heme oxygenase-like protein [Panus rudis PR-1116 ss-1]
MSVSETLTSHLTALSTTRPLSAATEHDFLTSAGKGTLSPSLLSIYLSQDRLYAAHAYPKFIGHLLASIPFSSLHPLNSPQEKFHRKVVEVLTGSLTNVLRETAFFESVARKYGLQLEGWRERKATRDYTAEMIRIGATGRLEDGLVFLWAMEKVYLDAWTYVKDTRATQSSASGPTSEAIAELSENWSNPEFVAFVDELANLVNQLDIKPGSETCTRAEEIWGRVIELEEAFWPSGEDEVAFLRLVQ